MFHDVLEVVGYDSNFSLLFKDVALAHHSLFAWLPPNVVYLSGFTLVTML
jgi:hypothetical protein